MTGSRNLGWLWLALTVGMLAVGVLAVIVSRTQRTTEAWSELTVIAERPTTPPRAAPEALTATDVDDDDDDELVSPRMRHERGAASYGFMGGMLSRYGYTLMMALAYFYFTSRDSRGSGFANGAGTYYLFWLVGPALLAIFLEHPAFLGVVALGLVARPWLPDPLLYLRYMGRTRRLESDIRVNRANVTARRDLALIWLEKRRAKRALPLLEEALSQDASSLQLLQLRGVSLLQLRRYQEAVDCFVQVVQRDSRHGFGEPYLRAADALIALGRWDDAEDALEHFLSENRSSVEGQYKRALVARGLGNRSAFKENLREARSLYREIPRYQQRRQFSWYVRALISSVLG